MTGTDNASRESSPAGSYTADNYMGNMGLGAFHESQAPRSPESQCSHELNALLSFVTPFGPQHLDPAHNTNEALTNRTLPHVSLGASNFNNSQDTFAAQGQPQAQISVCVDMYGNSNTTGPGNASRASSPAGSSAANNYMYSMSAHAHESQTSRSPESQCSHEMNDLNSNVTPFGLQEFDPTHNADEALTNVTLPDVSLGPSNFNNTQDTQISNGLNISPQTDGMALVARLYNGPVNPREWSGYQTGIMNIPSESQCNPLASGSNAWPDFNNEAANTSHHDQGDSFLSSNQLQMTHNPTGPVLHSSFQDICQAKVSDAWYGLTYPSNMIDSGQFLSYPPANQATSFQYPSNGNKGSSFQPNNLLQTMFNQMISEQQSNSMVAGNQTDDNQSFLSHVQANQASQLPFLPYQNNVNFQFSNSAGIFNQVDGHHTTRTDFTQDSRNATLSSTLTNLLPVIYPPFEAQDAHNDLYAAAVANSTAQGSFKNNEARSSPDGSIVPSLLPQKEKNKARAPPKPKFVLQLMNVLSTPDCQQYIRWMPDGNAFCIFDCTEFVEKILARYFKETKYSSFTRRLNRWGFKNCTPPLSKKNVHSVYCHELFLRDQPQLCLNMKTGQGVRKRTMNTTDRIEHTPALTFEGHGINRTSWQSAQASLEAASKSNNPHASNTVHDYLNLQCQSQSMIPPFMKSTLVQPGYSGQFVNNNGHQQNTEDMRSNMLELSTGIQPADHQTSMFTYNTTRPPAAELLEEEVPSSKEHAEDG